MNKLIASMVISVVTSSVVFAKANVDPVKPEIVVEFSDLVNVRAEYTGVPEIAADPNTAKFDIKSMAPMTMTINGDGKSAVLSEGTFNFEYSVDRSGFFEKFKLNTPKVNLNYLLESSGFSTVMHVVEEGGETATQYPTGSIKVVNKSGVYYAELVVQGEYKVDHVPDGTYSIILNFRSDTGANSSPTPVASPTPSP